MFPQVPQVNEDPSSHHSTVSSIDHNCPSWSAWDISRARPSTGLPVLPAALLSCCTVGMLEFWEESKK